MNNMRKLQQEMIHRDGMALRFVPDEFGDKEMCLYAVQQNEDALRYVPERLQYVIKEELSEQKRRYYETKKPSDENPFLRLSR